MVFWPAEDNLNQTVVELFHKDQVSLSNPARLTSMVVVTADRALNIAYAPLVFTNRKCYKGFSTLSLRRTKIYLKKNKEKKKKGCLGSIYVSDGALGDVLCPSTQASKTLLTDLFLTGITSGTEIGNTG